MTIFFLIANFTAHFGDVFYDAVFGLFDWLKVNDFSGTRRRKQYLAEAPSSFEEDKLPVVLGADKTATLFYDDRGFYLKNRDTGRTSPATRKTLRRFSRRGMKGIRSESLKLTRSK